jgi:hypothetical protein
MMGDELRGGNWAFEDEDEDDDKDEEDYPRLKSIRRQAVSRISAMMRGVWVSRWRRSGLVFMVPFNHRRANGVN